MQKFIRFYNEPVELSCHIKQVQQIAELEDGVKIWKVVGGRGRRRLALELNDWHWNGTCSRFPPNRLTVSAKSLSTV